jgi:hypothetical protein
MAENLSVIGIVSIGGFVADVSELGLRYVTGYIMTLGVEDFKFYEPWKDKIYKKASLKRGG